MATNGPIIIVEDDKDDQEIMAEVLALLNVPNQVKIFGDALSAYDYLSTTNDRPFVIFSDVNLPVLNGIEFKRRIDTEPALRRKSIPFVFLSTAVSQSAVNEAYLEMTVQGFFQKPGSFAGVRDLVKKVLDYWNQCNHPNSE
ncbi:MAG TPA: response regulator [Chitinophagaceae bacterium]